jgi:hypothetical protein
MSKSIMRPINNARKYGIWTPLEIIDNAIGWYDASDSSTVTVDTGAVSQWDDISGNGRHMKQATGGIQPTYNGQTINGLNVIWFEGTNDVMNTDALSSINLTEVAIISIGMPKTDGDYPNLGDVESTDASDKLALRGLCGPTSGSISTVFSLDTVSSNITSSTNSAFPEEQEVIMSGWYDGADAKCRINGGTLSATQNVADGATFTINHIGCGRDSNTPKNYHGEMVILNTASTDIIEKVEGYLAWKWKMVDLLLSTHPYKYNPPRF